MAVVGCPQGLIEAVPVSPSGFRVSGFPGFPRFPRPGFSAGFSVLGLTTAERGW